MIITESQFELNTKSDQDYAIINKGFSQFLEKKLYIFISHNHNDKDYVYRLQDLLKRYGFTGYVDWEDEEMPTITGAETALNLKKRIGEATKFILIATEAAIQSNWCNWELGYGDAHKFIEHIAIFPIKRNSSAYTGEEYLRIYPSIQVMRNFNYTSTFDYYVEFPDGKIRTLEDWLAL